MLQKKMLPQHFQALLWSQKLGSLDIAKDKALIIHHVLAYGSLEDIKWLFQIYSIRKIRDVFCKQPMRIYSKPCLLFVIQAILRIRRPIDSERYVKTLP